MKIKFQKEVNEDVRDAFKQLSEGLSTFVKDLIEQVGEGKGALSADDVADIITKSLASEESDLFKFGKELSELDVKVQGLKTARVVGGETPFDVFKKNMEGALERAGVKNLTQASGKVSFAIPLDALTKGIVITAGSRIPTWELESGVSKAPDERVTATMLCPKGPASSDVESWIERVARTDGGEWVGELEAPAGSALEYKENSVKVKRLSNFIVVPREKADDVAWLLSEIQTELVAMNDKAIEKSVIAGDVAVDDKQFDGLTKYAVAYDVASSIKGEAGRTPNDFDAIRAAVAQVSRNLFYPNAVFLHPDKLAVMDISKDDNGAYLMPPFASADGTMVAGVKLYPTTYMEAATGGGLSTDSLICADMSRAKLFYSKNAEIEIFDQNGTDAVAYAKTVTINTRLVLRIKTPDKPAFVEGTFTDIKAAMTVAAT
jgi:hypothetical protein